MLTAALLRQRRLPFLSIFFLVLYVLRSRPSSELSRHWYARSRAMVKARG